MNKKENPQIPPRITRRDFLKAAFGIISGFLTVVFSWPLFSLLLNPRTKKEEERYVQVPNFSSVPVGKPTKLTFQYIEEQAFLRQNIFYDIWVIKHSPTQAKVFSPLCTHLSC